jgi:8-oxo-dGTP pyrophosphatase MutT (NUDIX family)
MNVVYSRQPLPDVIEKSIFLAGPTPRSADFPSWRPEALKILKELGYDGTVFVPEESDGGALEEYDKDPQIAWETEMLSLADCIVFWVPRDLKDMPAFTTNIEWGIWMRSGRAVLGAPEGAPKMNYFNWTARRYEIPSKSTLRETLVCALEGAGSGARRTGGARYVPLHIWRTESFQSWHRSQTDAGNRLERARAEWIFRPPKKGEVFYWVLHVDMFVAAEDRRKANEVVIGRPDISCVCMYYPGDSLANSHVVMIKEFRSPARSADGFVWELPGGSTFEKGRDPQTIACDEVREETGIVLDPSRLRSCGSKQLAGTLSSHHAHVYAYHLTGKEFAGLKELEGKTCGVPEDNAEYTEFHIVRVGDLSELREKTGDWSTLGMIYAVLARNF